MVVLTQALEVGQVVSTGRIAGMDRGQWSDVIDRGGWLSAGSARRLTL
jgi:hypothetical protein